MVKNCISNVETRVSNMYLKEGSVEKRRNMCGIKLLKKKMAVKVVKVVKVC